MVCVRVCNIIHQDRKFKQRKTRQDKSNNLLRAHSWPLVKNLETVLSLRSLTIYYRSASVYYVQTQHILTHYMIIRENQLLLLLWFEFEYVAKIGLVTIYALNIR